MEANKEMILAVMYAIKEIAIKPEKKWLWMGEEYVCCRLK